MNEMIAHLPWDSDFFGKKIGSYPYNVISEEQAAQLVAAMAEDGYDCVYAFLDPNDIGSLEVAAANKFLLIDTRLLYEYAVRGGAPASELSGHGAEVIAKSDKMALDEAHRIGREMSEVSRFHADKDFRSRASDLYGLWVEKIVNDPCGSIIGIKVGGELVGFVGCELKDGVGELVLVAVDRAARGGGIGRRLIYGTIDHLLRSGAQKIVVKTQMHNIISNRAYQRCGFVLVDSKLIYHIKRA